MRLVLICSPETGSDSSHEEAEAVDWRPLARMIAREVIDRFDFTAVYASPDPAAHETAIAIANGCGLIAIPAEGLGATAGDFDSQAGRYRASAVTEDNRQIEDVQERAWREVEQIRDRTEAGATVAVVCKSLVIHSVVCRLLGIPLAESRRFEIAPGSLSTLDFRPNRTILAGLNETCHLK